jgi:hypothetical protein
MKKSLTLLIILFLLSVTIPFTSIAADTENPDNGTIIINVTNQAGELVVGNWYLHMGGISGAIPRNGSSGETFQIKSGIYYLEAQPTTYYKARSIDGDNPKTLPAGGTVTFHVIYYPTQEAKDAALSGESAPTPAPTPAPAPEPAPTPTPAPAPTPEPEAEDTGIPVYAPDFSTPPVSDVPDFSTSPQTSGSGQAASPYNEEWNVAGIQLAQTGPELLFLLIPSVFGGLYFASRRKKN